MTQREGQQPPGWYYAHGDPPATQRYWDGTSWVGAPQPVPGSEIPEPDLKTARPMPRVGARLLDWLIWAANLAVVGVLLGRFDVSDSALSLSTRVVTVVLVLAYETVMVLQMGATVGKRVLGLEVVDRVGDRPTATGAVRRVLPLAAVGAVWAAATYAWWAEVLAALVIVGMVLVGFVTLFTGRDRQTPWDRIGETLVVSK